MPIDTILYVVAFIFFIIAAAPMSKAGWAFEWLAFAALVLTLIV